MPGLVTTARPNHQRFLPLAHAAQQTGQILDPVGDHVDDLALALHPAVARQQRVGALASASNDRDEAQAMPQKDVNKLTSS